MYETRITVTASHREISDVQFWGFLVCSFGDFLITDRFVLRMWPLKKPNSASSNRTLRCESPLIRYVYINEGHFGYHLMQSSGISYLVAQLNKIYTPPGD